jgi:hypothetical protein
MATGAAHRSSVTAWSTQRQQPRNKHFELDRSNEQTLYTQVATLAIYLSRIYLEEQGWTALLFEIFVIG